MQLFFALLSLVAFASALQISSPSATEGWSTLGPNYVTWNRVSTDPLNFTIVLVNESENPTYQQVLDALVDASLLKQVANPPSKGFPVGKGFQVNLVQDAENLKAILAQSSQFEIVQSNVTTSSTTNTPTTPITVSITPAESATDTNSNPTSTSTSTKPKNGADRMTVSGSAGLIFGVLAAMVL